MTSAVLPLRAGGARRAMPGRELWRHRTLHLFMLPFALLTGLFGLWPIIEGIRIAFLDSSTALSDAPAFVGFDNFRAVLADPAFLASLWRTLLFTAVSVALNVALALALALLLSHRLLERGRTLFKLAIFLPTITPDVAGFIVWKWAFNQDFGVVNHVLAGLGLPGFAGITTPPGAFATLVIVELWHHVGLYTLIFLTNFQLLDRSLEEAAQIDGANRWQRMWHVVVPQLRPAITINTITALIEFLKTFTVVFVITRGGPDFSTNFLSYLAYSQFNTASYGQAAATATLLFALVLVFALGVFRAMEREAA
jgi:ABC-type sugar transport system permease subunit